MHAVLGHDEQRRPGDYRPTAAVGGGYRYQLTKSIATGMFFRPPTKLV